MPCTLYKWPQHIDGGRNGNINPVTDASDQGAAYCSSKALAQTRMLYQDLWVELTCQRTALIRDLALDGVRSDSLELFSDLAHQASFEHEQEPTMLGKARLRHQLRAIDRALECMDHDAYGLCIRCREVIPISRLRVQPTALLCVSCQTIDERKTAPVPHRSHHNDIFTRNHE